MADPSRTVQTYSPGARAGLIVVGLLIVLGSAALLAVPAWFLWRSEGRTQVALGLAAAAGPMLWFGIALVVRGVRGRADKRRRALWMRRLVPPLYVFSLIVFLRLQPGANVVLWAVLALNVAFALQLVIHELGHVVAGTLVGFRFESYSLFGWVLRCRAAGGLEWTRFDAQGPDVGGLVTMTPTRASLRRARTVAFVAGGVLANALVAEVARALEPHAFASGPHVYWLCWALHWTGYFMAAVNVLPVSLTPGVRSDGLTLWTLVIRSGSDLSHRLARFAAEGVRARDWPVSATDCIRHARSNQHDPAALLYATSRVLDGGTVEEQAELFPDDFEPPSHAAEEIRRELRLQLIQLEALSRGRVAAARRRLTEILDQYPEDAYVRLTEAAVLLVEGRTEDARRAFDAWNAYIASLPNPGYARVGNHWAAEQVATALAAKVDAAEVSAASA